MDFQNDIMPGYQYQYDDDDYHFIPRSITILPTRGEYWVTLAFIYQEHLHVIID